MAIPWGSALLLPPLSRQLENAPVASTPVAFKVDRVVAGKHANDAWSYDNGRANYFDGAASSIALPAIPGKPTRDADTNRRIRAITPYSTESHAGANGGLTQRNVFGNAAIAAWSASSSRSRAASRFSS